VPFAYVTHTIALIQTLTDSDETMDDFDEKVARFFTIIKFMILGPMYLLMSIPLNSFVFFYNLYTQEPERNDQDVNLVTKENIEML